MTPKTLFVLVVSAAVPAAFAAEPAQSELPATVVVADRLPAVLEFPDLAYPEFAARRREAGTVEVSLLIDAGGITSGFAIERSSGSPRLDAHALGLARAARFQPATRDGENVDSRVVFPVRYELRARDCRTTLRLASN